MHSGHLYFFLVSTRIIQYKYIIGHSVHNWLSGMLESRIVQKGKLTNRFGMHTKEAPYSWFSCWTLAAFSFKLRTNISFAPLKFLSRRRDEFPVVKSKTVFAKKGEKSVYRANKLYLDIWGKGDRFLEPRHDSGPREKITDRKFSTKKRSYKER